jgi:hypothetical protein
LDGNGLHDRLCEQIVHPVTGARSMLLRGQAAHPRVAATAPITRMAARQNNTTAARLARSAGPM